MSERASGSTGYVVFAHGSSIESANDAVRIVAAEMASPGGLPMVVAAFLEGGKPDLSGALETLAGKSFPRRGGALLSDLGTALAARSPKLIENVKRAPPRADHRSNAPAGPASGDGGCAIRQGSCGGLKYEWKQVNRLSRDRARRAAFRIRGPGSGRLEFVPGQFTSSPR